jgi:eukaryotic-like serine/threonine-protein kinase
VKHVVGDSKLARYDTISPLGAGGMASVVLAEDTLLGRRVALKRMHTSAADPRGLVRLRREALVGASMNHHNLVSIYDVIDSADGDFVIVMEYVHGETLRDALSREGRLAPREALLVLGGIAGGLDAIHARGIVHRDVKPANVLIGMDGIVKLADLGIASVADYTRITTAGTVLGSFRYMAPEQLKEGPASRAIDIYALAAVAFEVLSGRQARREPSPLAVAHAIATQPPPDLREIWPGAPRAAAEVLIRGMCRDPEGRPPSAGELVARLRAALEPDDTAPLPASAFGARGARATAAEAGAVAAEQAAPARARATGGRPGANIAAVPASAAGSTPAAGPAPAAPRPGTAARRASGATLSARDQPATTGQRPGGPVTAAGPRKTFRAGRPAAWARVLAPLALMLVAGGLVLALLNSGGSSSTGSRDPQASGTTGSRAHSRSAGGSPSSRTAGGSASSTAGGTAVTAPAAGSAQTPATSGTTAGSPASSRTAAGSGASSAARSSVASAGTVAPSGAVSAPGSPAAVVQAFYRLAAAHRYSEAWALADPTFRIQLAGYAAFKSGQAADRSITFDATRLLRQTADAATVYVQTTSVRTTGTEHCSGTVRVVRSGTSGGWLLHRIAISCT